MIANPPLPQKKIMKPLLKLLLLGSAASCMLFALSCAGNEDSGTAAATDAETSDPSAYTEGYQTALDKTRRAGYTSNDSADIDTLLTRANLAIDITHMAGFDESLKSYIRSERFDDIEPNYQKNAAELAVSQGFIEPASESTFDPNGAVTYKTLCRAVCIAAGYRVSDDWCALAAEKGLDAGIHHMGPDADVSYGAYATMMLNLLDTTLVQTVTASDGTVSFIEREGRTPKNTYLSHSTDDSTSLLRLANSGWDIFDGSGYRYGPSMIINSDGTIDLWSATDVSGLCEEIDWGRNRRSYDGGKSWTAERICVRPSPNSQDWQWSCDPGVFKLGDYYYAFYTSILYTDGVDNNLFVCRSASADGSFDQKWCGDGWHTEADGDKFNPVPVVTYDGAAADWGAGEGCGLVVDGVLYVYSTWKAGDGLCSATRVFTASADDENWPASLEYRGSMCVPYSSEDSCDVKYVDAYGCFIAVAAANRFTADSYIHLWVSYDGITFRHEQSITTNLCTSIHNMGIAGLSDGHIDIFSADYVAYAYQPSGAAWGAWPTRFVPVTWLGGLNYGSEGEVYQYDGVSAADEAHSNETLGIIPKDRSLAVRKEGTAAAFSVREYCYQNGSYRLTDITADCEYVYDSSLVSIDAAKKKASLLTGKPAWVYITYNGMSSSVYIYPKYFSDTLADFYCEVDEVVIRFAGEVKQPAFISVSEFRDFTMLWGEKDGVTLSGWDESIVKVNAENGQITPVALGETSLTAEYMGYKVTIPIRVASLIR